MSKRTLKGLLLAAGVMAAACPALGQENLKLRPGTDNVVGAPGSLQDLPAPAPIFGPVVEPGYHPPMFNGHPDLGGVWNNETLTGVDRPKVYGTRAILTPDEVAAIEGANNDLIARGNACTDAERHGQGHGGKDNCSGGRSARRRSATMTPAGRRRAIG